METRKSYELISTVKVNLADTNHTICRIAPHGLRGATTGSKKS